MTGAEAEPDETHADETQPDETHASAPRRAAPRSVAPGVTAAASLPWVTGLCSLVCVALWVAVLLGGPRGLERAGYRSAHEVWSGSVWALLTTAFLHREVWHIGMNVLAFVSLAVPLERVTGSVRFLVFVLGAACVSSATELALGGSMGIGLSGVVYAVFAYAWIASLSSPAYVPGPAPKTVQTALVWFVACWVMTATKVLPVANWAHTGGLVFGALVGLVASTRPGVRFAGWAGVALTAGFTILSVVYVPWSAGWACAKGYAASARGDDAGAIVWFDRTLALTAEGTDAFLAHDARARLRLRKADVAGASADYGEAIRILPTFAGAYTGRALCRLDQGEYAGARSDLDEAIRLAPAPLEYAYRAMLRRRAGDVDGAIADSTEALRLSPGHGLALLERARARSAKHDAAGALADFDEAIRRAPGAGTYQERAREKALVEDRAGALADLAEARRLSPTEPYAALWSVGFGADPKLLEAVALKGDWISTVVRFYAGKVTRDELLAEADRGPTERKRQEQRCEAHNYLALLEDRDGDRQAARGDYEACLATGIRNFVEFEWAERRLAQLAAPTDGH